MSVPNALTGEPIVLGLNDTLPQPSVGLNGVDDLTNYSATMELVTATGATLTKTGAINSSSAEFDFTLDPADTTAATFWRTYVTVTEPGGGVYTLPGFPVAVVDYPALWTTPAAVNEVVGLGAFGNTEVVYAIIAAEDAVRAWVATSVPTSPVPERVRRATTLLAAHALTSSPAAPAVLSETIGDYSVRYAEAVGGGITGEIARLLEPWSQRKKVHDLFVGPDNETTTFYTTEGA